MSVKLVQYYFGNKAELLAASNRYVLERSATRLMDAVRGLGTDADPRAVVTAALRSFLPTDAEARDAMTLFYAFYAAQLTGSEPGRASAGDRGAGLQRLLAHHIARGQQAGTVPPHVNADHEATLLFLLLPSLASGAAAGDLTLHHAENLVDYAVRRIFQSPPRPPGPRSKPR